MRYKFTEIKGIKRIRKSINKLNECDIQYPKLDEDFVTTDTDQDISGKKSLSELKIYNEDKRVLPPLQDNILFGNVLNESFIDGDSGYGSNYNVPEYREYSLRRSYSGYLNFDHLISVNIGNESVSENDTLFSRVYIGRSRYDQPSKVSFTSIDSSKYEATILASDSVFNVEVVLSKLNSVDYKTISNCRAYVDMAITETSFSGDCLYENSDFVDIGSEPKPVVSLFKNKEIKILTSTNDYNTFLSNVYNMKIAIRIVKNVEGSLLKDSSYNLGTSERRLKCAYLDEIDVEHNYVKSLTLRNNNLLEYMNISKESTFNKDNYGNPSIYPMTGMSSVLLKYPNKGLCDLYIAGYDYLLDYDASTIHLNSEDSSTLIFKKGNYVKTSSQHAQLLPTQITLLGRIDTSGTGASTVYRIYAPTLRAEFDNSAFNKTEYNKFKFYPHIQIGNFLGRYMPPSDPEAYYGNITNPVISVGSTPFDSNGIDELYEPEYCFNPGVTTPFIIEKSIPDSIISVPSAYGTTNVYIECSVIMYYTTRQKENLAGDTSYSATSIIDLGNSGYLRRLNTIYCNAIDISQSAKLPYIHYDSEYKLKVPVGAMLRVRISKNSYGSGDNSVTIELGEEFEVSNQSYSEGSANYGPYNVIIINKNSKMLFWPIDKLLGSTKTSDTPIYNRLVTPGKYIAFERINYDNASNDVYIDTIIQRVG